MDFDIKLTAARFEVPRGMKIHAVKNAEEGYKVLSEASRPAKKRNFNFRIDWLWNHASFISIILAIIGIAAVGIVIGVKIRQNRRN